MFQYQIYADISAVNKDKSIKREASVIFSVRQADYAQVYRAGMQRSTTMCGEKSAKMHSL